MRNDADPRSRGNPRDRDPRIERSRALILDAATRLLTEGGPMAVTIEAVTARSGVARSTLYRHFTTSTEVLAAAFERSLPAQPPPRGGTQRERLLALVTQQAELVERALLSPVTVLVWLATLGRDVVARPAQQAAEPDGPHARALRQSIRDYYRHPFEEVLRDQFDQSEAVTDEQIDLATAQLVGPLIYNALVLRRPNTEQLCARVVDDFLASASARGR